MNDPGWFGFLLETPQKQTNAIMDNNKIQLNKSINNKNQRRTAPQFKAKAPKDKTKTFKSLLRTKISLQKK